MIDFEYYVEKYNGTVIPDALTFNTLVTEATAIVDRFVVNNQAEELLAIDVVNNKYSNAVCAVADVICKQNAIDGKISSESVGNHSVSYFQQSEKEKMNERYAKAKLYLVDSGLMYGGM